MAEAPAPYQPPRAGRAWQRRAASFGHAARGVAGALRTEPHLQIHAVTTVLVVGAGLFFGLTYLEWALVALAVAGVWAAELYNTAIEVLVNLVSPEFHPLAGRVKDLAAGAVLLAALGALAVGGLVFGPKVWALLMG